MRRNIRWSSSSSSTSTAVAAASPLMMVLIGGLWEVNWNWTSTRNWLKKLLNNCNVLTCRSTPFSAAPLLMFHFQITGYLEYQRFSKDLLNSQCSTTTEKSSVSRKVLKQVKELMRLVGTPENQKFEHKYKIRQLLPNQPSLAWISVMLSPFSIILPSVCRQDK